MTAPSNGVKPPIVKRPRHSVPLAAANSKEAKRLVAAILEVLAGARTPQQATAVLGMSLPRYYQVEARALQALLAACEAKPKGRQPDPRKEVVQLQRDNERLQHELNRQQSLTRMAQRSLSAMGAVDRSRLAAAGPARRPVAKNPSRTRAIANGKRAR